MSPTAPTEMLLGVKISLTASLKFVTCGFKKRHQEQTPPTWHTVSEILHLIGHDELSQGLLKVYKTCMILNDTCYFIMN